MFETVDLMVKSAAVAAACSIMDFPATHMEKSGRYPGSRALQLAYSASGGIGSLLLIAMAALSLYFIFTIGFLTGVGMIFSIVVTNKLFVGLAAAIGASPRASSTLMPWHPFLVVVGGFMLFQSGWALAEYIGWLP